MENQLRRHHVAAVCDWPDDLPHLQADRQQLRQLFLNLFSNAIDAMPNGGTLTVRVRQTADALALEVADTGQGITPENLAVVMEPFFTTKPEGKGTGLGLPISRRIVREHGGTFELESDGVAGHGTVARIVLPLAPRPGRQPDGLIGWGSRPPPALKLGKL